MNKMKLVMVGNGMAGARTTSGAAGPFQLLHATRRGL